jgi:hypothetical protein
MHCSGIVVVAAAAATTTAVTTSMSAACVYMSVKQDERLYTRLDLVEGKRE